MGTFHQNKGELHGITVVVETDGAEMFVGRCDEVTERAVILLDADVHREDGEGPSREEYLDRASRFGVWARIKRLEVPRDRVTAIRRLAEIGA